MKFISKHDCFEKAYEKIINNERKRESIGTLGEKTIHAILKNYIEPCAERQEKKIGRYFTDIFTGEEVIEIQTKQFQKLKKKLAYLLAQYPVILVYPVEYKKKLFWIEKETEEISKGRISNKRGSAYEIFLELYKIKEFLSNKNIRLRIILLEVEEYRILDGWSADRKKGATKQDKIPKRIVEEILIENKSDYKEFIPKDLSELFDSKEFAAKAKIPRRTAQICLNILTELGCVIRIGKKGNYYLYQINSCL